MSQPNGESNGDVVLTTTSEFPLTVNNLEGLAKFRPTDAGLCLVSNVSLPAGAHFTYLTSHKPQPNPIWRTIQTSPTTHTDPRSALLYMNHSCQPSIEVHVYSPDENGHYPQAPPSSLANGHTPTQVGEYGIAGEIKVAKDRGIEPGDDLTFFYPSTEWSMDRAFDCLCGAPKDVCLGRVAGANKLDQKALQKWFFNEHVHELARQRDQAL